MDTETDVIALYKIVFIEVGRAVVSLLVLLMVAGVGASVLQNMPQFVGERIAAATLAHLDRQGLEAAVRRSGLRRVPEVARQARLRHRRA